MYDSGASLFIAKGLGIEDVDAQMEIVDDYTLKVSLPGPNAIALRLLNVNNSYGIGPEARKASPPEDPFAYEWTKLNAAALGPYMLESWDPGQQQVYVKNPYWWGQEPEIDKIIYREVPESANRVALLISGEGHIARELTYDELDLIDSTPGLKVECSMANIFVNVIPNIWAGGPVADLRVRQALNYAAPYQEIIDSVYGGRARRIYGYTTDMYTDYLYEDVPEGEEPPYPYHTDIEKAKDLLDQAGYADGLELDILVLSDIPEHERIAILLKDSFAQAGIDLNIIMKPAGAYKDLGKQRQYDDLILYQSFSIVLDPTYHALVWFAQTKIPNTNQGGFTTPEFNQILQDIVLLPEGPERKEMNKRMQEIVVEEAAVVPLVIAPTCFAFSEDVAGFTWHTHNQLVWSEMDIGE